MSLIYWDTMLFVYLLEDQPQFAKRVQAIVKKMEMRRDTLCTSALTVGEALVGPLKLGKNEIAREVRSYFDSPAVEILPFTIETAERYASLRADHRIAPADAIHLASASLRGVDLFLTNDDQLRKLTIPGIQFIAGLDVNIF